MSGSIRFESAEKNRPWGPPLARARTKPRALAIKFKRYPRLNPWLADFRSKASVATSSSSLAALQALLMSGADRLERVGCFVRTTSQLFVTVCPAGQKS